MDCPTQLKKTHEKSEELLPLDSPERVVVFSERGRIKRHFFRRITAGDWDVFYSHCHRTVRKEVGGVKLDSLDTDFASLKLYSEVIIRASGYDEEIGCRELQASPSLVEAIPRNDRLNAVIALTYVTKTEGNEPRQDDGFIGVRLNAMWSESEKPGSMMMQYEGLEHLFARPSGEQLQRYASAMNRAQASSAVASGKATVVSAHHVLANLYDELIEKVAGYSVKGRALADKKEIVREMDRFHKCYAASKLFELASSSSELKGWEN